MNYQILLKKASSELNSLNIKNPILDSEILLANSLKISREKLILNLNKDISNEEKNFFNILLNKRKKKEPIAYIFNNKEFWKTNFFVNRSVLIPRPDTEILVEESLKYLQNDKKYQILDIGTGSGCILISILKERKKCRGTGIDLSKEAIKIAEINAKIQQLQNRVNFIYSGVDKFLSSKYDLIVSNPPYIKTCELKNLNEDIKNYEPIMALDGGSDGLSETKKIIIRSSELLKRGGRLVLEIGHCQLSSVANMLKENKYYINNICKDLAGKTRCITSIKI